MEIQFKEKFLEKQTLHKTNDAKTLIKLIRNNDLLTGSDMAFYLAKMPQEIRKTIQYIRENSSKLLKPNEFLIAYNRGYEITTDKKKIKAWADKHHKKAVSGLKQVNEAWNAIQARK